MATTTVSIETFKKDTDRIAEASADGPVFITRPHGQLLVLLTADEYGKLKGPQPNILELLGHPEGVGEIDFEPPRMMQGYPRNVDLSDRVAMYLIDTNIVSEFRKEEAGRADRRLSAWAQLVDPESIFLSVITIFELEIGVLQMERRDAVQGAILRQWLKGAVLKQFAGRVLPTSLDIALRCAALHIPDKRPERDAWIAATALVHGMTVVTRNAADFEGIGVTVFNPWTFQAEV